MLQKRRRKNKGFTLLELMVSLVLFTIVMMTFAMVFPNGYRLNFKNRNRSKAAQLANGIVNKIKYLRFLDVVPTPGTPSEIPTIESLQNHWRPGVYQEFFEDDVPQPFFLPDEGVIEGIQIPKAIDVKILDEDLGNNFRGSLARVRVTVCWYEAVKTDDGEIVNMPRMVTVTSYRSINHQ